MVTISRTGMERGVCRWQVFQKTKMLGCRRNSIPKVNTVDGRNKYMANMTPKRSGHSSIYSITEM